MTAIASSLDVSYKTVQHACRELGAEVNRNRARPRYPAELAEQAVRRYVSGESTGQIARTIGASDSWVQAKIHAAGIALRPSGELAGRTEELSERYLNGESSGQIAAALGVTDTAVLSRLKTVPRRELGWPARSFPIRHDAFSDPTSSAAAYWAGFLMADGCVYDTGRVTLALQERDRGHVEAWMDFLGSSNKPLQSQPPSSRRTHAAVRGQVSSRQIVEDLGRHGVVPHKTLAGVPASDALAAQPAFWRGMVDGDGTVGLARGKYGPVLSLCGSPIVMAQFAEFLSNALGDFRRPSVLERKDSAVIRVVQMSGVRARRGVGLLWGDVDLNSTRSSAGDSLRTRASRGRCLVCELRSAGGHAPNLDLLDAKTRR
jgi:hypothetical protein